MQSLAARFTAFPSLLGGKHHRRHHRRLHLHLHHHHHCNVRALANTPIISSIETSEIPMTKLRLARAIVTPAQHFPHDGGPAIP